MSEAGAMPCTDVVARLWEYVDGELTAETAAAVRAHLEECARCFPHYDVHRAYMAFLRRHAERPVPVGLRERVFRSIMEEEGRND